MNEKVRDKSRWRLGFMVLLLLMIFTVIAFKQIISYQVHKNRSQIETLLQTSLGFPVSFEAIDVGLFSLSLRGIIVFDVGAPVPFFSIRQIKFFPNWWACLVNQKISFYKIILKDPKCLAKFDPATGVTLLGLQGETISSGIDYAKIKSFLKSHKQLLIREGQIQWRFNGQTLNQNWNGHVKWIGSSKTDWRLGIDQHIRIAGALPFESQMNILVTPLQDILIDAELGSTKIHAVLESIADHWQLDAQLAAAQVDLQALQSYYQPKEADSKLLYSLMSSLKTGLMQKIDLRLKGPLQSLKLEGNLAYEGVDLDYQASWPAIEGAKGTIQFQPEAIQIQVNQGSIQGALLQKVSAVIEYAKLKKPACVSIEGSVSSRLEAGLAFLEHTPLRDSVAKPLKQLALEGPMQLDLKLQIPWVNQPKVQVTGVLSTQDAILKTDFGLPIHQLKADFYFNESSFKAKDFSFRLWDYLLQADLSVDWLQHRLKLAFHPVSEANKTPAKKSWTLETTVGTKGLDFNEWSIASVPLTGKIRIESLKNKKNKVHAVLSRCSIDSHMFKTLPSRFSEALSGIDFLVETKSFEYNQRLMGDASLSLVSQKDGYEFQEFSLHHPSFHLQATGFWKKSQSAENSHLQGQFVSTHLRKALSMFGYESIIREAYGTVQYHLDWPGNPWMFDLNQVEGAVDLKLDKGRIMGVDPGLGRVMGLLNLENIKRRLRLDFSDLFKKGFVFDILRGKCQLNKGIFQTNSLVVDGPSAKIHLSGDANLTSKAIDLNLQVYPHMGAGLPLAAAVAVGNPALGAGMWVVNKLTGSKLSHMTDQKYQVGGTWDAPLIKNNSAATHDSKNLPNK